VSGPIEWCHALVFVRQDPIASGFAWYFHEGEEFFSIWFRTSWPPAHANHCLLESTLPIVAARLSTWWRSTEISSPGCRLLGKLDARVPNPLDGGAAPQSLLRKPIYPSTEVVPD